MNRVLSFMTVVLVTAAVARAEELPRHAASIVADDANARVVQRESRYYAPGDQFSIHFSFLPSPGDDVFEDAYGLRGEYKIALPPSFSVNLHAAVEQWSTDGTDDANMYPLGISLSAYTAGDRPLMLEAGVGLQYQIVSFEPAGVDYDNGIGATVHGILRIRLGDSTSFDVGAVYRASLLDSEASDSTFEDLKFDGIEIRTGFSWLF